MARCRRGDRIHDDSGAGEYLMEHGGDIFLSGTVLLAAALVFVLLFRKLGLGAVLGYLVGGIIIGPEVLQLVADPELIVGFAEIGIVLLLFLVGLELAPARLWQLKRDIFGLGLSQVVLCGLALAAFVYFVTGSSWGAALGLGLPLALSSTAQVLPLLQSQGRLEYTDRRARVFRPAVPGSVDRSAADDHRSAVACAADGAADARLAAGAVCAGGHRRAGGGGSLWACAVAQADRQGGRARTVHRRGPVCGVRQRSADALDRHFGCAGRLHRRA